MFIEAFSSNFFVLFCFVYIKWHVWLCIFSKGMYWFYYEHNADYAVRMKMFFKNVIINRLVLF